MQQWRFSRAVIIAAVVAWCGFLRPPALLAQQAERVTVLDVAPLDSFAVLNIPDWPAARTAAMRSELGRLWAEESVRKFVQAYIRDTLKDEEEDDESLWAWVQENLDWDDVREPAGAAGLAVFARRQAAANIDDDEQLKLHALIIADFGDDAEHVMNTLSGLLDRLERERRITLDEDDHDGVDIRIFQVRRDDADDDDDDEDDPLSPFSRMMLASAAGKILLCSDRGVLESALDRIGGRRMDSLGENRVYRAAAAQHPANAHALLIGIITEEVRDQIGDVLGGGLFMLAPMMRQGALVDALGISGLEALGLGLRFDTDAAIVEQTIGVLVPDKRGLVSLLDASLPRFDPPAFVPADAASAWSMAVRFDRVMGIIRSVIRAMPPEMGEAAAMEGMVEAAVGPILNSLGSEVHIISLTSHPFTPDSQRTLGAIRLRDPLTLANSINAFAPQLGVTARDFEGNQIFEPDEQGMGPTIGIGFDHVFLGSVEEVENAMRLASRPDAPRLAGSEHFRRALGALGGGGNVYSFTNMRESLEWNYWSAENAERIMEAQWEWADERWREQIMERFRQTRPKWHTLLPPRQLILDHIGDSVMEVRPTDDGFRGRSLLLRPAPR